MIIKYPHKEEIKAIVEEELISKSKVREFLKKRGIFILNSNTEELANEVYKLFLGAKDLRELRNSLITEKNYKKSSMMIIQPKSNSVTADDLVEEIADDINRYRTVGEDKYTLKNINRTKDGKVLVKLGYTKLNKGKIEILRHEEKSVDISIEKIDNGNLKVDIRQENNSDLKAIQEFFDKINVDVQNNTNNFNIKNIVLDHLNIKNRIILFDEISKFEFEEWRFETITGITVCKGKDQEECEDEDQETDGDIVSINTLQGINNAVLNGEGLRNNGFVNECTKNMYYFTSVSFRYSSKNELKSVIVDVTFKGKPNILKVNISKTYDADEEGKEYVTPLSEDEQEDILKVFHEAILSIYDKILQSQKVI